MSSTRVISEGSLRFLMEVGNNINVQRGFRTISLHTISSYHGDDTIEVPDVLNSSESLQFCGLDTQVADMLFQNWIRDNEQMGPGSLGYGRRVIALAREYIKGMSRAGNGNALRESDDWVEALKRQGIKESTRNRILDPNFKNIRLSRSAAEWALDTLELSWEFLDGLDERVEKIKRERELRSVSPDPSVKPSKATKPSASLSSTLHSGSSSLKLALETETPKNVSGRTLLHKGGAWSRLISIFNSDGSLDLTNIVSTPPVDFHPTRYDLCFSKQWDVAHEYAEFAQRRVPAEQGTVLTVAVPAEFLSVSREVFGSDWSKLIWYSRNKKALIANGGVLPKELAGYKNAEVLIGFICGVGNNQIKKMEIGEEIPVLRTKSGAKGSQIVLQGPDMLPKFKAECRGFIWVSPILSPKKAKYFPPPT
jgi:hypothetical protein